METSLLFKVPYILYWYLDKSKNSVQIISIKCKNCKFQFFYKYLGIDSIFKFLIKKKIPIKKVCVLLHDRWWQPRIYIVYKSLWQPTCLIFSN